MPDLLSESVLQQHGPVRLVRRYWRGHWPTLGRLHSGLTGAETAEERSVVVALHRFEVHGEVTS